MKKTLLYLLTIAMILLAMAGCNANEPANGQESTPTAPSTATAQPGATATENPLAYLNTESTMPIINDGHELALDVVSVPNLVVDPEGQWIWAFYKQYCNLDLNVTYYDSASWGEQVNLLFTSGNLPDVFWQCPFTSSDMVRYGQAEGMFYPMEELLGYAPLIEAAIAKVPAIQSEATTPDGHMYCIPNIQNPNDYPLNASRYFIHQSWLDALSLQMPATLDDLTAVLTAFKDNDPSGDGQADEIPWIGCSGNAATVVLTALGINAGSSMALYARDDGAVSVAVMEDNYIHYLEYMKNLMENGLLDPDYYTMTSEQFSAKLSTNTAGLAAMAAPFVYMPDPEQYEQYQALPPLTSDYNSEQIWPIGSQIKQGTFAIAYNSEYPEAAMRMADIQFIHEAPVIFWLGPIYTSEIPAEYLVEGYTDGLLCGVVDNVLDIKIPGDVGIWDYLPAEVGPYGNGPVGFGWDQAIFEDMIGQKIQQAHQETYWRTSYTASVVPYQRLQIPNLFLEPAKLERSNELIVPITDYVNTMEAKFIMGNESLDGIQAFIDQLKTLGIEEYLQLQQEAYDAYIANNQ